MKKATATPKQSPRPATIALATGTVALVAIGVLLVPRLFESARDPASSTAPAPIDVEPTSLYGVLLGRWARTDGDYLLDIRAIDGLGKAEVDYYNPRPIHVARAEASRDGENRKIVVVLEDVGYPGSYYSLAYSAGLRQLVGEYYQATLQETFEVSFTRLP